MSIFRTAEFGKPVTLTNQQVDGLREALTALSAQQTYHLSDEEIERLALEWYPVYDWTPSADVPHCDMNRLRREQCVKDLKRVQWVAPALSKVLTDSRITEIADGLYPNIPEIPKQQEERELFVLHAQYLRDNGHLSSSSPPILPGDNRACGGAETTCRCFLQYRTTNNSRWVA